MKNYLFFLFAIIFTFTCCKGPRNIKKMVTMNSEFYQVKIVNYNENETIDSTSMTYFKIVLNEWGYTTHKCAQFMVNPEKFFYTKIALKKLNSFTNSDSCRHSFKDVKFFIVPYKHIRELNFLMSNLKSGSSFLIEPMQIVNVEVDGIIIKGLLVKNFFNVNRDIENKLVQCGNVP